MTVTIAQSVCLTPFDKAFDAALCAGWTFRPAFDAVCLLLASGLTAPQIEWLFLDCARRLQ
jgi:hypothetical protein